MKESQREETLAFYRAELDGLLASIKVEEDGEHLWENYQKVTAITLRLQEMHNEIAYLEIDEEDWPQIKKLRTLVIDPTIERLEKVAAFESRKLTAKAMEFEMEKK